MALLHSGTLKGFSPAQRTGKNSQLLAILAIYDAFDVAPIRHLINTFLMP